MKRILATAAAEVANKMLQKFWGEKIIAAGNEASVNIMNIIDGYVPSDMRQVIDAYDKQFGMGITNLPTLSSEECYGKLHICIPLAKKYPQRLIVSDSDIDRVKQIIQEFKAFRDNADEWADRVELILTQLKYEDMIEEFFPEANKFIDWGKEEYDDKKMKAVIDELRNQLNIV